MLNLRTYSVKPPHHMCGAPAQQEKDVYKFVYYYLFHTNIPIKGHVHGVFITSYSDFIKN